MASASPIPIIKKSPSPSRSSQSESSSYTSSSSAGSPPTANMGSEDLDFSTHGDLRSPSREFTRDRDLRKKSYKSKSRGAVLEPPPPATHPGSQPSYDPDTESKSSKPSKKHKKKNQETVVKVKKREDRRRSEASLDPRPDESLASPPSETNKPRHRRTSSHNSPRPQKPSTRDKSPTGLPTLPPSPGGGEVRRHKSHQQHTQYNVDEGTYERVDDLEAKMAEAALLEKHMAESRGGRMTRGLEEIDRRARERRREEALRGVVEGAVEKFEGGEGKR